MEIIILIGVILVPLGVVTYMLHIGKKIHDYVNKD